MSDLIPEPKKIYVQRPSNYLVFFPLAECSTGVEPLFQEKYIRRVKVSALNTEK